MASAICSISGCEKTVRARGWCSTHYDRWRLHGNPLGGGRTPRPSGLDLEESFRWFMPDGPPTDGSCWEWPADVCRNKQGYGNFRVPDGSRLAHRAAYEIFNGKITESDCVLHTCDNPPCCNPEHLFLGDRPENSADKVQKDRQARGEQITNAKLTADQVRKIRALHQGGMMQKSIAAQFGMSTNSISRIVRRVDWKHI